MYNRFNSEVLIYGEFKPVLLTKDIFFERQLETECLTILLNFSKKHQKVNYKVAVLMSNYSKETIDGSLEPYEANIIGGNIYEKD